MYTMGGQPFWVDERGVYHLDVPEGRHNVRMPVPEQPPLPEEAVTPPTEEPTPQTKEGLDYERLSSLYPGITVSPPTEGATEIEAPSLGYYGSAEALPGALEFKRSEERKLEQLQGRQRTAAEAKKKFPTREQFEQRFLAGKLGQYYDMVEQRFGVKVPKTDPYMLNSTVLANELYQKDVKRVWTEFFPGLRWGSPLTAKQKRAWQDKHTEFQQWSYANGQMIVEGAKDLYKTGIGMYEDRKKEWEAKRKEAGRLKTIKEEATVRAEVKKEFAPAAKPELKPNQALKQINSIVKARATIDKTNTMTDALLAMIAKDDPKAAEELAPFLGRKLSEEDRASLEEVWQKRIDYLLPFIPEASRPKIKGFSAPSGLSEEDIRYNMETYGKTRKEVIDQYSKRKK